MGLLLLQMCTRVFVCLFARQIYFTAKHRDLKNGNGEYKLHHKQPSKNRPTHMLSRQQTQSSAKRNITGIKTETFKK